MRTYAHHHGALIRLFDAEIATAFVEELSQGTTGATQGLQKLVGMIKGLREIGEDIYRAGVDLWEAILKDVVHTTGNSFLVSFDSNPWE